MNKKNTYLALITIGLVLLCINPSFTQGQRNMNVLLNVAMCLAPLVLLLRGTRHFIPRLDIPLCSLILCVLLFPVIFHPETIRISTMLFTCAYCVFFMMLARVVKCGEMSSSFFLDIIRKIIYAFAIILLIQQLCVLTGLPVPLKAINYQNPWKLNSLTAEPSHTTVILSTLMFFYTRTIRKENPGMSLLSSFRQYPWLWAGFTWTIYSTDNASAFVLGPLCLLPYLSRKNIGYFAGATAIALVLVLYTPLGNINNIKRVGATIEAVTTLDEKDIIKADTSASARLVTNLRGIRTIDFRDVRTITGYGVDADWTDTAPRPCDKDGHGSAGIFSIWHNYGALAAIFLWVTIGFVTLIKKDWLSLIPFVMAMQLSGDYNMQLMWVVMAFSMIFKYSVCHNHQLLSEKI